MDYQAVAFVNMILCVAIVVVCVRRLSLCHPGISPLVRLKYTMLLSGSIAAGFQPIMFNTWPSVSGTFFAFAVYMSLLSSMHRWNKEAPRETRIRSMRNRAAEVKG